MQIIDQKHRGDPEACCREMQLWSRGMGRQPATLELLVEILTDCNYDSTSSASQRGNSLQLDFSSNDNRMTLHFVGHHLATKVFIGKLPATRGVWVIIG